MNLYRSHNCSELTLDNLRGRIFSETGIPVREMANLIGRKVSCDVPKGSKIRIEDLA